MENPSHSRQPHHRSASAKTVGGGFLGKALYDDVYGGPPRFGLSSSTSASTTSLSPRLEDYSEIFGAFNASRASSIPVLELPSAAAAADDDEDNEVFFDVRSSGFDYSEVFGGFDGLDFAVAYDDLVKQKTDGGDGGGGDSSDEAWTPAESGSLSEESNHSPKKQSFSDGDPYYSFDGGTEFSLSYHKAHQERTMDSFNGMKHATQAPAPGYRFLRDEITPLQQTGNDYPTLHVTDDLKLNSISNAEMVNEKHFRKTLSLPTNGNSAGQAYGDSQKPERRYGRNGSCYYEPFVTVSDISLRTQSSHLPPPRRPPPIVDSNSGESSNSNTNLSDSTMGDSSPPFFDVEVDASSSAAASAAAMKEVMEKARVQLKSAKELMERKKEGFHSHSKSRSTKELTEEEGMVGKVVDRSGSMKYDIVHGTFEREDSGMKFAVSDERQAVLKKAREVPEYLEDEKPFKAAEEFSQEKHAKGSWSSQGSFKIDEASEWQEATQYIELVAINDTKKAFEQANEENTRRHEHRQKERATIEVFEQQETYKKVRAVIEDHDPEELEKKCRMGWEERDARSNDAKEARRRKEHEKKVKVTREIVEKGPDEKSSRGGKEPAEADKQRYRSEKSVKHDNLLEVQGKENEFKVENSRQLKDNEAKSKENARRLRREERHKEARGREGSENRQEALQQAVKERRLEEAFQQAENERRLKEEQVENEKKLKKARELQETEKKLKEALEREKINMQKEAAEREEEEKRQKDALEREENDRRLKMAHAIKKSKESRMEEGAEGRMKEAFRQAEIQNSLKEAEKTVKIADDREEMKVRNKTRKGTEWNETIQDLRSAKGTHLNMEGEAPKDSNETYNWACDGNPKATQIAGKHKESRERLKESQEVHAGERKTECKTSDTQPGPEVVEPAIVSLDSDFNTSGLSQDDLENGENQFRREDANESIPINAKVKKAREEIRAEPEVNKRELGAFDTINVRVDEMFKATGMTHGRVEHGKSQFRNAYESIPFVSHVEKAGEAGTSIVEPQERLKSTSLKNFGYDPQKMECAQESKERRKDSKQVHAFSNEEENSVPELVKEFVENKRKTEAAHPAMADINSRKSSQQVNAIPAPEWKDNNLKEDIKNGERETERLKRERELENDRLRKMEEERERERERELENDRLRKMEEEREREREREKDRMAVDRATLEAHEWASVETRGRAERAALERATAEARQRAIAEARERLEKACAEAREKSLAGKAAMEARLKAERAAVERATAEARERAAEKLMASARNNGLRQCSSSSDLQNPGASRNCTVYERYEGAGGESAQRCKARLERHARTAERAAKALAEKNMRDLLAQKEQTERNRLAETLDADVKRWSSGKEGNLRALLSTLQYILGADSGWQPIPLTEVITAPAVKRAYRKATLCVHPDKLQQRGATIHQKYICEKVFDLLKEAWSKFNSEER